MQAVQHPYAPLARLLGRALMLALTAALLASPASAQQGDEPGEAGSLSLNRLEIARGVEDRLPTGTEAPIVADGEPVYVWLEVDNREGPEQVVTVRWHHVERDRTREQTIEVGRSRAWRTWVYRSLSPRRAGTWRVEVIAPDGSVLGETTFEAVVESE